MKNFINILKNDKYLMFAIVGSIVIVLAILILVFEPFTEIPFIYNQF